MVDEEFIPVEDVAEILQVKIRQAHRYGEGPNARIRTRKAGHRKMFHKGDTLTLAADLGVLNQPRPNRPKTDLVPAGEMLEYIRERDRRLEEMQQQLISAAAEIGRLQAQLEMRLLPEDAAELRRQMSEIELERDQLRRELENQPKPWWKRLFG